MAAGRPRRSRVAEGSTLATLRLCSAFAIWGSGLLILTASASAVGSPAGTVGRTVVGPQIPVSWSIPGQNAEVEQAIDPATHYLYTVWMGGPIASRIAFARSMDGGASFGPALTIPGSKEFSNSTRYTASLDPAIATSSNGTIYVSYEQYNLTLATGKFWGYVSVAASYDHGKSFTLQGRPLARLTSVTGLTVDRDFLAVAPNGTLYVSWSMIPNQVNWTGNVSVAFHHNPGGWGGGGTNRGELNVVISWSRDGGRTWSRPHPVEPGYPFGGGDCAPLVIESSGAIDMVFQQYRSLPRQPGNFSDAQLVFTRSTDGGRTWTAPVVVGNPADRISTNVWWIDANLALGPGGTLYATYDSQLPSQDVGWLVYSTNHGRSWSPPVRMTSASGGAMHIIQVTVGPDGTAFVGWITNDSARGWDAYVAAYSVLEQEKTGPVRVNAYYDQTLVWPGDTIGLVTWGHGTVALAYGIGQDHHGFYSDRIFNVVVQFHDD